MIKIKQQFRICTMFWWLSASPWFQMPGYLLLTNHTGVLWKGQEPFQQGLTMCSVTVWEDWSQCSKGQSHATAAARYSSYPPAGELFIPRLDVCVARISKSLQHLIKRMCSFLLCYFHLQMTSQEATAGDATGQWESLGYFTIRPMSIFIQSTILYRTA